MGWKEKDNLRKKLVDRHYVSCDEEWEMGYIVRKIAEVYGVGKAIAEDAVKHCCNEVKAPRKREDFINCIDEYFEDFCRLAKEANKNF